nr:peptide ABC transporter substrate-binding protein [Brockia lithotrophica]
MYELLAFPTYFPLNERFYAENREKYASEASSLLYNGPFVISEWVHGSHVVLTKNPNYWDRDSVNLERVTLNVLKDVNTAVHLYEVGQIDRVVLSGDLAPKYRQRDDYHAFVEYFTYFLMFNFEKPPFQNAKVRKALAYAVDRKSYVETVLQNGSPAAYGLVPEGEPAWAGADTTFRDWSKKMFGGPLFQDVGGNPSLKEEAKKLLEEGLRESGIPLEKFRFTLLHDDNETARKAAEFLKASWKQNLGVEVELKQVTFKDRLARMRRGDFEVAYTRWGADYNDPETWLGLFETGGAFNWGKYANPAYDHALALARSAGTDYAKRTDAYAEAEKILIRDDMGIAPLDHRAVAYLQKPYVQGLFMRATGASIELKWAKVAR